MAKGENSNYDAASGTQKKLMFSACFPYLMLTSHMLFKYIFRPIETQVVESGPWCHEKGDFCARDLVWIPSPSASCMSPAIEVQSCHCRRAESAVRTSTHCRCVHVCVQTCSCPGNPNSFWPRRPALVLASLLVDLRPRGIREPRVMPMVPSPSQSGSRKRLRHLDFHPFLSQVGSVPCWGAPKCSYTKKIQITHCLLLS